MKNSKGWPIWIGGGVMVVVVWLVLLVFKGINNSDFKMAVIGDNGIMIRSVSPQRGMSNELWVDGKVSVWVPGGMGWYQSDKIGKLLVQEKKEFLAEEVIFYNFGFVPDIVVWGNDQGWLSNPVIIKKWGLGNYIHYLISRPRMMVKRETIDTDLMTETDLLNEVIQRDFADSRVLEEDLRLTVYNFSQSQGLANFMSRILEWSGFEVVGVDNYAGTFNDKCLISYGSKVEDSFGFKILQKEFSECRFENSQELDPLAVELYFGDSYSQMLNYPSYKINN
jgi:hypothetical protein